MSKYPGLGLPLRHFPQHRPTHQRLPSREFPPQDLYTIGTHTNCFGGDSDILPVREVVMMMIMDRLMDKNDWEKKVFDDEIIAKWRKEALEYPDDSLWTQVTGREIIDHRNVPPLKNIMSNEVFDYCIRELRNKARYYESSGLIPTLDACATVVKSDKLVSSKLQDELRKAFDKLKADQRASPDWHPNSGGMVQDLVHPSMYPLVYGRSRGLKEGVVGVKDAIDKWAGKGEVIHKDNRPTGRHDRFNGDIPPNFWSDTYQWLPSNAAFQSDGSVKLTSYINNLHPNKYPDIYRTIEKLIEKAIPAWDQCLVLVDRRKAKTGAGRTKSRFSKPENPDDDNPENWDPPAPEKRDSESPDPSNPEADIDLEDDSDQSEFDEPDEKWRKIRKPVQPQFDFFEDDADYYTQKEVDRLAVKFKDSGLQIIVKMASIELTPEKPEFPVGGWHVEGQMNERICATALYYLDSSNITSNDLSFRMQTSSDIRYEYSVGQDGFHWMEQIYGTELSDCNSPSCLQNYGSVETREGRLLAFPNVFQHRVSPFRLTDPTKPGHRRFIALWLVDPHSRIISTANVPPQQLSWWTEAVFSNSNSGTSKLPVDLAQLLQQKGVATGAIQTENAKLPPEIREIVREYFDGDGNALLMGEVEAREHRENLMQERSAFHDEAHDAWHEQTYNFCEH